MAKERKKLVLTRGVDYTLTALANHLNEIHGGKSSGARYTAIDVQKYVKRGHLPSDIGGDGLVEVRDDVIGVKIVRIIK